MLTWDELENQCGKCTWCKLSYSRNNVVFGVGARNADIMFIGEGPGEQEDKLGEPFVGAAGKLLDDMLSIIDLNRSNVYIANIVKCRPPHNRDPEPEEENACIGFLFNQIALVQPKIVICLGRIAARRLIHDNYRVTVEHGKWFEKDGIQYMGTFHPSALLRDAEKRPEAFMDLLEIRKMYKQLNCKIS